MIVECGGNAPFERVEHSLKPGGALLLVITSLARHADRVAAHASQRQARHLHAGAPVSHEDLAGLSRLAEEGAFRPVIDRTYDLDDIVEAHRYVDSGRKRATSCCGFPEPALFEPAAASGGARR